MSTGPGLGLGDWVLRGTGTPLPWAHAVSTPIYFSDKSVIVHWAVCVAVCALGLVSARFRLSVAGLRRALRLCAKRYRARRRASKGPKSALSPMTPPPPPQRRHLARVSSTATTSSYGNSSRSLADEAQWFSLNEVSLSRFVETCRFASFFFVLLQAVSICQMTCETPSSIYPFVGSVLYTPPPQISGFRVNEAHLINFMGLNLTQVRVLEALSYAQPDPAYFNLIIFIEIASFLLLVKYWELLLVGVHAARGALLSLLLCVLWGVYESQAVLEMTLEDEPVETVRCYMLFGNGILRAFAILHLFAASY